MKKQILTALSIATILIFTSCKDEEITKEDVIDEVVAPNSESLVVYYPFNGDATDESSTNVFTKVSGATLTEDRFGNSNSAYYFNGVNGRIYASNNSKMESQAFTISAWVKNENETNGIISLSQFNVGFYNRSNSGYYLGMLDNEFRGLTNVTSSALNIDTNPTEESLNEWKHVVFTNDSSNSKLYVDGLLISSKENTTEIDFSQHNRLQIGAYATADAGSFFKGSLDEIRIYNIAFSSSEVESLFLVK